MKYFYIFFLLALCNVASAQQVGSKVSFLDVNGKTQTGFVTSIWFKHFKVKSDKSEFWLDPNQITLLKTDTIASTNDTPAFTVAVKNKVDIQKDDVLSAGSQTSKSTIKEEKVNNVIGSKVWVVGADGKTYAGVITDSSVDNYKVKYDGSDDEAWADKSVFNFVNTSTEATANKTPSHIFKKGDKVEFDIYSDGSKWVRGTIVQVNAADANGCLIYKVNYDSNHNYNFHMTCKQVRSLSAALNKIKSDRDSTNQTSETKLIDTSLTGNYSCFQAVWDYNTKTNSWEAHGIVTLNANGTFQIVNDGITGHYEWDSFKNIIKFHDGLEGAIAIPGRKSLNTEIKILFKTKPAKIWTCSTHRN